MPAAGEREVTRLVRDALRHLHDPVHLQTHPLASRLRDAEPAAANPGRRVHQLLVDAIAALRPAAETTDHRVSRRHDLLVLRYLEGLEIDETARALAISRRQYNREHHQALEAVAAVVDARLARPQPPTPRLPATDAPGRLPQPLTSFVGREREIAEVLRLLASVRLVTLTGPPGSGKTRLAVRAAELAVAPGARRGLFADGVAYAPLAAISDPALVIPTIARALGVREAPNRPLIEAMAEHLAGRRSLLVLDNVEHLLAAAPAIADVLSACLGLTVLATSRAPLQIAGEHQLATPPLSLPELADAGAWEAAAEADAVRLYLDRARAAHSGFTLTAQNAPAVAAICRRLDGLPLAIELAAARSKVFPPYALLARLDGSNEQRGSPLHVLTGGARDAPARQQTLRDAIAWSHRLLTAEEQRLFAQLAVFAGGWDLAAAAAVADAGEPTAVMEGVASLVDKSLVQPDAPSDDAEARFALLETMRTFAWERLEEGGAEADAVRRRHAEHYLALAQRAEAAYWGPEQAQWQRRLGRDLANLRAAMSWARDRGDTGLALKLAASLRMFWFDSGLRREGLAWLEEALALAARDEQLPDRAAALLAAGDCNWLLGNALEAEARFAASLAAWRTLDDRRGIGQALQGLGVAAARQGQVERAQALTEEALTVSREAGDLPFVALALHGLGLLAAQRNDEAEARLRIEESRSVWEALGDAEHGPLAVNSLGDVAMAGGRPAEALRHYRAALEQLGPEGPPGWRAIFSFNLGRAAGELGDEREATALFDAALALFRAVGDRAGMADCAAARAAALVARDPAEAVRLLAVASTALDPSSRARIEETRAAARDRLGADAFAEAWRAGEALTLTDAVAELLGDRPPAAI